ncbi:MAG: type IV pili twitching motility protein PilT [Planctomycetota bacterium]|nr:MAG: type IV pili twitching motility protein PilT [Planctomycetota bacterium]
MRLERLLEIAIENEASDVHLTVGLPPVYRVHGRLRRLNAKPLTPEDTVAFMKSIASERCQQELNEKGTTDFSFSYGEKARFRVSCYRQRGYVGIALRLLPTRFMSFEEIGLPHQLKNLLLKPRGLLLVTGPTGSGKTTTLATMVDFINANLDRHIVTVEDPIEYLHSPKKSIITQREVGVDVESFAEALRRVLRMDPDVILIGEMRDLETIQAAITAAETGHLVLATLHTMGAGETVDRIIDAFPPHQQAQIRTQLSVALLAVISQTLLPRADNTGRIAAFEVMFVTPAIANLIRDNKTYQIPNAIVTAKKEGMFLLDDFLFKLFVEGKIRYQDMMERARDPVALQQRLKNHSAQRAQ